MGRRALKRKLGKKVLAGQMTVTEARARLGRGVAQKAAAAYSSALDEVRAMREEFIWKGAFPANLEPFPTGPERELAAALARGKQQQAMLVKSAKRTAPAGPSAQDRVNKAAAAAHEAAVFFSSPPVMTRQLSGPERATVAAMAAERDRTCNPARRESLNDQIARIQGLTPVGGV